MDFRHKSALAGVTPKILHTGMITLWVWQTVVDVVSGEMKRCWTYKYCSDSSIQAKLMGSYLKYLKLLLFLLMNSLPSVAHQLINEWVNDYFSSPRVYFRMTACLYLEWVCMTHTLTASTAGEAAVMVQAAHGLTRLTRSIHSLAALHTAACKRARKQTRSRF